MLPENPRKVLVLHGPNLNMLGVREPRHYGRQSLPEIDEQLVTEGTRLGVEVTTFQNNAEHYLIDKVHAAYNQYHFLIINPAALTHTSVALRDAIAAVDLPFIEVHLSNVHAREPFRRHSYFSDIAVGVISGLGGKGYLLALHGAMDFLDSHHRQE